MYQIMIVSEQRSLVQKIASYLDNSSDCQLHVVLFGHKAVEQFAKIKPDIVFLDTKILAPYIFVMEEMKQYHWHYSVVLLGAGTQGIPQQIPIIQLLHEQINKQSVLQAIWSLTRYPSEPAHPAAPAVDRYHIFAVLPAHAHDAELQALEHRLQQQADLYGKASARLYPKGVALSIPRSTMTDGTVLSDFSRKLLNKAGSDAVVLYESDIHWSILQETMDSLFSRRDLPYFLRGRCAQISCLEGISPVEQDVLHYSISKIAEASLGGKTDVADNLLQALYLRVLKQSYDRQAASFANCLLGQLLSIEAVICNHPPVFPSAGIYLEDDWEGMRSALSASTQAMRQIPLSENVRRSIVMMFGGYEKELFLSGVASQIDVNKVYLSRIFHEQTGYTFVQMLMQLRMEAAKFHLQQTDARISAIAQLVGYQDANYFSRQYKKYFGVTPQDSRRKEKDENEGLL